jgi:RNA polymerase sigma factor (TIGR02999 family)
MRPVHGSASASTPLTHWLQAWQRGDREAFGHLIQHVHGELRRMAAARLHGADTPSLAVDDLLHDALLKLMAAPPQWQDRAHFFATLSMTMRSVLVDHARARQTGKRGGDLQRVTFSLADTGEESMTASLLTLDALLTQLAEADPRAAEILQLTYFGGLARDDIAAVLELSVPTIDRELRFARAWLSARLEHGID